MDMIVREVLARASERPKEARDMMELHGFVLTDLDDRWQKLAFSLYSMLVEAALDADNAIVEDQQGKEEA